MIDITIVVDVLLTRFDSKYLNTLYVDKKRKQHRLIQAFSRTNRVLNGIKPYGNILDCRQQQDAVDAAIALFSGENCSGRFPAITSPDHLWCGDQRGSPSHTGRLCVRRRPFRTGDCAVTTCADIPGVLARGGDTAGPCERTRARPLRLSRNRVTAQVDSRPSRAPITSGAVTNGGRQSGPHSPLCGSESGDAPSARLGRGREGDGGGVRLRVRRRPFRTADCAVTTFADIPGVLARGEDTAGLVNERGHARSGSQEIA